MTENLPIYTREGAAGPRAALIGTRLDVWQVIETVRQNNNSVAEAAAYLGLPEPQIEACITYYQAHTGEIDDFIKRSAEAARAASRSNTSS